MDAFENCRVKTSPPARSPKRAHPPHDDAAGSRPQPRRRDGALRGCTRRGCWQLAGTTGNRLTSCMPYTDRRADDDGLRLSTCQYRCPLGTVIDRC